MPISFSSGTPTRRLIEWSGGNPPDVGQASATSGTAPNLSTLSGTPRYTTYVDHDHQMMTIPSGTPPATAGTNFTAGPVQTIFEIPTAVPSYTLGVDDEGHYHVVIQTLDMSLTTGIGLVGWIITPTVQSTPSGGIAAQVYTGSALPNGVPLISFSAVVTLQLITLTTTATGGNINLLVEATVTDLFG